MDKLAEIRKLMHEVEVGELFEQNDDGTVTLDRAHLTPFGEFVLKLERVIDRDDGTISQLLRQWQL